MAEWPFLKNPLRIFHLVLIIFALTPLRAAERSVENSYSVVPDGALLTLRASGKNVKLEPFMQFIDEEAMEAISSRKT